MALDPTNISGITIGWQATMTLRLVGPRRKDAVLQQLWKNQSSVETEWRDVPLIHEEEA